MIAPCANASETGIAVGHKASWQLPMNLSRVRAVFVYSATFKRWHISIVSAINLRCTREMAAAHFFTQLSGVTHHDGVMNQVQAVSQVWEKITGRWHLVQEHSTVHDAPV